MHPPPERPDRCYFFHWNRMGRKGQRCRILARGRLNTALVQFQDGHLAVVSRNALRKAPEAGPAKR
ncbi:MAG TPA: hypothetical protein VHC86_07915 [Opitutaceae bacterium]|nr:hypothetical protein [Opitutaceae bacterium]